MIVKVSSVNSDRGELLVVLANFQEKKLLLGLDNFLFGKKKFGPFFPPPTSRCQIVVVVVVVVRVSIHNEQTGKLCRFVG